MTIKEQSIRPLSATPRSVSLQFRLHLSKQDIDVMILPCKVGKPRQAAPTFTSGLQPCEGQGCALKQTSKSSSFLHHNKNTIDFVSCFVSPPRTLAFYLILTKVRNLMLRICSPIRAVSSNCKLHLSYKMSTSAILNSDILVTLVDGLSKEQLEEFPAFKVCHQNEPKIG